jgi:hypothetical protein
VFGELSTEDEKPEVSIARVVHHDVEPAEMGMGLADRRDNRGMIGHVERDGQDGVAEFVGEVFQGADVTGGRGDLVATPQGRLGPAAAEAARSTGDEPGLAHGRVPSAPRPARR